MVDEFPQAQVPGEGGRQEQAGIGHQAVVVKDDRIGRDCSVPASIECSLFPGGFLFQNHYPRFRGAPSASRRPNSGLGFRLFICRSKVQRASR